MPEWWLECVIEEWTDDGDPIHAVKAWHDARANWAEVRGLERRNLPTARSVVPRFRDGCSVSHRYDEACDRPPPRG